jgi:hypothetical protein
VGAKTREAAERQYLAPPPTSANHNPLFLRLFLAAKGKPRIDLASVYRG